MTNSTCTTGANKGAGKSTSKQQADSTHNNNDKPLLVALLDSRITDNNNPKEIYVPLRTACPRTGVERDYLQVTTNNGSKRPYLVEMQQLSAPPSTSLLSNDDTSFSSWMVGNHVIANNSLYVLTRVDPLFWMLPNTLEEEEAKQQWQPLDQLLASKNQSIVPLVYPSQWPHLFKCMQLDEDEVFYQFDQSKALQWLQKKQERVYAVLLQQCRRQLVEEHSQATASASSSNQSHGAFAAGFTLPSKACCNDTNNKGSMEEDACHDKTEPTRAQLAQAKRESVQLVCNYLSEEWQTAFLSHLKMDKDGALTEEKENVDDDGNSKRRRMESKTASLREHAKFVNHTASFTAAVTPSNDKKEDLPERPKVTLAQKKLLKVNKKGMKSMTAFFGVKKKVAK